MKLGMMIYRYCDAFKHDFKRCFKVTSKIFEILNTFNVNVKPHFVGKIMAYIEICAENMLLLKNVANTVNPIRSMILTTFFSERLFVPVFYF